MDNEFISCYHNHNYKYKYYHNNNINRVYYYLNSNIQKVCCWILIKSKNEENHMQNRNKIILKCDELFSRKKIILF